MRLLAAILVITALTVSCDVRSKCVWGPSYWCQSSDTAKECGKESYCQKSVWTVKLEEVSVKPNFTTCDVCELGVSYLKMFVDSNCSETEVKDGLEKLCAVWPPLFKEDCLFLFEDVFGSIWGQIQKGYDVCKHAGCNSTFFALPKIEMGIRNDTFCDYCKMVVNKSRPYVYNKTSEALSKKDLIQVCGILPSSRQEQCTTLVDQNFKMSWQYLERELDNYLVCKELGLCSNNTLSTSTKLEEVSVKPNFTTCDVCELGFSYLKMFVDSNCSETEVKDGLKKLCAVWPPLFKEDCSFLFEDVFGSIWGQIQEGYDVCKHAGCNSTLFALPKMEGAFVNETPCEICKMVVNMFKPYVFNKTSETLVKKDLIQVCGILPSSRQEKCTTLVDQNFKMSWQYFERELDNYLVCKELGQCSNETLSTSTKLETVPVKVIMTGCDVCELGQSYFKLFVANNCSENVVMDGLKKICTDHDVWPPSYQKGCTSTIDDYFPTFWNLFQEGIDVCTQSGCNDTFSLPFKAEKVTVKQNFCDICKMFVDAMKPYVDSKTSKAQMKKDLEQLCGILPSSQQGKCISLIEQNFTMTWTFFEQELENYIVCKQIQFCPNNTISAPAKLENVPMKRNMTGCDFCELERSYYTMFVHSNCSMDEVIDGLKKICDVWAPPYQKWCKTTIIDEYFPTTWWYLIQEGLDSCKQSICNETFSLPFKTERVTVKQNFCDVCKKFVDDMKPYVDNKTSKAQVKKDLEQLCGILPSSQQGKCISLVEQNFAMTWIYFEQELENYIVCKQIQFCPNNTISAPAKLENVPMKRNMTGCDFCELERSYYTMFVHSNCSMDEVIDGLKKTCDVWAPPYQKWCKTTIIDEYFPTTWWYLIQEGLDSCKQSICNETFSLPFKTEKVTVKQNFCDVCKKFVDDMKPYVDNKTSEAQVKKDLEQLCCILPSSQQGKCISLVKQNFAMTWIYFEQELGNYLICKQLQVCPNNILSTPTELVKNEGKDSDTSQILLDRHHWLQRIIDHNLIIEELLARKIQKEHSEDKHKNE